eukprot:TRINITY_DN59_c0_g1_i2.p1 TRINITY_DN59_c0_g1~~TRINITY_DN59_c0_g1_i2.p1  ORF type:complete len:983 (+),score=74.93 TRINITY_DN59_c0_g1_i2:129-2951(+)
MVIVTSNEYDDGLDSGDGNLTAITHHVDASTTRLTSMTYDFRDRRHSIDGELDYCEVTFYDNLGRVVSTEWHDTTETGTLIAKNAAFFDAQGRVYRRYRYGVDPDSGTIGAELISNRWYDEAGQLIKSLPAGSKLFTKLSYDGIGRMIAAYAAYDHDEADYAESFTVYDDTVMRETHHLYDDANNLLQRTVKHRYHSAPQTKRGPLGTPTTSPKARITYETFYSDAIRRTTANVRYGTNGGYILLRPDSIPQHSDTVLVTSFQFDDTGSVFATTDPEGSVTHIYRDAVGRVTTQIDNFVGSSSSNSSSSSSSSHSQCSSSDDRNRTTLSTYSANGQQATLTVVNAATGDQTTRWIYGVDLTTSDIASSQLLRAVEYPGSVEGSDALTYTYNRRGQRNTTTDPRGCVHAYDYDKLGRQIHDRVTTVGVNVDDAILRLSTTYDVRGMVATKTSWNNSSVTAGDIVNQCAFVYSEFQKVCIEYQEHYGEVNTSVTPCTRYAYSTDGNTIRPTELTYPNGRVVTYSYGEVEGINDSISRICSLVDSDDESTHLVDYSFLGLGRCVTADYAAPAIMYTLADPSGNNDPTTGDIYSGLDLFARIKDCRWYDYDHAVDIVRLQYGHDRVANRRWKADIEARALGADADELYSYDGLHRLASMKRGLLDSSHSTISDENVAQCWSLDSASNWRCFNETFVGATTLEQVRSNNTVNEVIEIDTEAGPHWITPSYDAAGNTSILPKPSDPTQGLLAIYDAWNRLVTLVDSVGNQTIERNVYDGRSFRAYRVDYTSNEISEVRHFYYSSRWQSIEERLGTTPASSSPERQFVWGQRYLDDLVLRDRSTDDDGVFDERLYALQDVNWSMSAFVDEVGAPQERYLFTPFGSETIFDGAMTTIRSTSLIDAEILFTGQRYDAAVGLYSFRNRVFAPNLGGFVSRGQICRHCSGT